MMRSVLLVVAGMLAAGCLACVPPPGTAPMAAGSAPLPIIGSPTTPPVAPCPVVANPVMVSSSFNETSAAGAPIPDGIAPQAVKDDIVAAYNAASPTFRSQLCGLDGIFVTSGRPWGYRDRTATTHGRYIALSMQLWAGNPLTAIPLNQFENAVFAPGNAPRPWPLADPSPPAYLPASPNTGTMTVLAALAHEFGHVLWADVLVSPRGTPPQSSRFCGGILTDHIESGHRVSFWKGAIQPAIFKHFGDQDPNPGTIPDEADHQPEPGEPDPTEAKITRMYERLAAGRFDRAHHILWRVLGHGRPFPSVLGAFSANEQFVETFTLYTLLHAQTPLTNLPLQVSPGRVRDIPAELGRRRRLSRVLQCFDNLPSISP